MGGETTIINSQTFSFLATVFVLFAAFIISSKKAEHPKVRIYCFISYIGACVAFTIFGIIIGDPWIIIQQVFLFFLNVRGINNNLKKMKVKKNSKD